MDSQASFRRTVAGLVAVSIALAFAGTADAAYPGRNGKIAFSANSNGNYDIYTIDADGNGPTRLTDDLQEEFEPKFSPDGSRILFVRLSPVGSTYNLWVMNADGRDQRLVVRMRIFDRASASWSPDGTLVVYTSSPSGFTSMGLNGTPWRGFDSGENIAMDPAWSPDGSTLAFATSGLRDQELFSTPFATPGLTRALTRTSDVLEANPAWSPDGRRIVYADKRHLAADSTGLRIMNHDGTGVARVPGSTADGDPQWSPDGRRLVVSSWDAAGQWRDLATLDPDGTRRAAVTALAGNEIDPDWQPLPGPRREDHRNDSKFCAAERAFLGEAAFAQEYHTFGGCVSAGR